MVGKIMLIGLGELGSHILQLLARTPGIGKIVTADIDEVRGFTTITYATITAAHQGFYPDIIFKKLDLFDVETTMEVLKELRPDLICNAAALRSWWVFHLFPEGMFKKLNEAGLGPQTPFHLTLTHKLMQAVKKSGINAHVVSCPYPDVVNPILGKRGLAPTVGGGNFDLLIPGIKLFVSRELNVPMRNISVFMVAHHGLLSSFMRAPFWVKILAYDKDVSAQFPPDTIREFLTPFVELDMGGGVRWRVPPNEDIAASYVRNMLAIYFDTGELCHAPGPAGLPGGYSVRLSAKGAEVVLPEELTLDEAIKINEEGARFDGIKEIKDDGTLVFTEKSADTYKEVLGYDCKELKIEETEERAKELGSLFKKFADKHKVKIP